jgi:hypothetical protein
MSVWLLAVPVTADTNSQQFRYIWVQGQTQTSTAAAQISIDSRTLETRKLVKAIPEAVFIQQVVLEYVGGGTANWRINTTRAIVGSRVNQVSVSGASGLSSINSDSNYFSGLGTPASQLTLIAPLVAEKTTPIDADSLNLSDSADSGILKKLTWANLKATLIATAMTWTGKQTFDGGATIKGIATAPAAGYVGEVVSAAITDTSAATSDTAVTLANGLVLGIGRWEIYYSCLVNYTTGSSLNDRGQTRIWVYDNGVGIATVIGKTLGSVSCRTVAATGNDTQATLSSSCIVDITTGTKDYRLGCKRLDGAGTGSATVYGGDFGNFYAIRRA